MDYNTFINGLIERGFVNTEEICGKGNCHKDNKHYILLTDGLIIYSSIPDWTAVQLLVSAGRAAREECWEYSDDEYAKNVFSFEKLDKMLALQ